MSLQIKMQSTVNIDSFSTVITTSFFEERPEIDILVQQARQKDYRISYDMVQGLYQNCNEQQYKNVIAHLYSIGICEKDGHVHKHVFFEESKVPVPEYGAFQFWTFQNSGLGNSLLHVERIHSVTTKEEHNYQIQKNMPFSSVVDDKVSFMCNNLHKDAKVWINGQTKATLNMTLREEQSNWWFSGSLHFHKNKKTIQKKERPFVKNWISKLPNWFKNSNPEIDFEPSNKQAKVPFSFVHNDLKACQTFKKNIRIGTISRDDFYNISDFQNVEVEHVQIVPKTEIDAQQWVMHLFYHKLRNIKTYTSRHRLIQMFHRCILNTPLEAFQLELPPTHELIQNLHLNQNNEQAFYLQAALDLTDDTRGSEPYTYGLPNVKGIRQTKRSFEIEGKNVSYQELLTCMLQQKHPQKVLLIDKHLYQKGNPRKILLFMETLLSIVPNVTMDLVAPKGDNQKEKIAQKIERESNRKITTLESKNFFDDQQQPHDRYIFWKINEQQAFGWRLTHTIFNPKVPVDSTPQTPLKWEPLGGIRQEKNQFINEVNKWLQN